MLDRVFVVAVAVGVVIAAGCSSSDGLPETATESSTAETTLESFCSEFLALQGERPASYVGSPEHVADIERLSSVAPADVAPSLATFLDFVASGAVDAAADPDSTLTENWPPNVQTAIADIQSFGAESC
ncbi:MAG: hypothetical protein AAGA42_21080 [Actinomycetota bacterium]